MIDGYRFNFLVGAPGEIQPTNRIFEKVPSLYPEIEEGSQVTHHKVASAGRYGRKYRLEIAVRDI